MNAEKELAELKKMLDESQTILKDYQLKLQVFIRDNHVPERTIAAILEDIFEYLIQTIEVLRLMMLRDKPFFKQSAILVRSIFEYSVRAAWASRIENGWMKYQAYWAHEDKKWANEAKSDEKLFASANSKLENLKSIIEQSEVEEESITFPNMKQVLKAIWQKDIDEGYLKPEQRNYSEFIYTNVYRPLSRYVHGNVFIFQTPDESLFHHIGAGTAQSAFYICYAFIHTIYSSPKNEIEILEKQIVAIFKGNQNESV